MFYRSTSDAQFFRIADLIQVQVGTRLVLMDRLICFGSSVREVKFCRRKVSSQTSIDVGLVFQI